MIVVDMKQNSEEWEEFRKGKSGGSGFNALYNSKAISKNDILNKLKEKNGEFVAEKGATTGSLFELLSDKDIAELKIKQGYTKRYYEMLAETVARPLTPNDYGDNIPAKDLMKVRGHILEPMIADLFEKKTGKKLDKINGVWVSESDIRSYISPDRAITSEDGKIYEAVEIKALSSPKVLEIWKTNKIPDEYMPQIVKYFIVNDDLKKLYWVVGTDLIPNLEIQIFEVKRENIQKEIDILREYEKLILNELDKDVENLEKM